MLIFLLTFYPPVIYLTRHRRGQKKKIERKEKRDRERSAQNDDRIVVVGCANKTSSFVLKIVSEEEDELEIEQPPTQRFFVFFVFLDDE